ncbi:MAG: cysteine desulfurase-like protein [Gemmatimonadetes bacterium]|nr:cysteine desulfurase-like protein [Gemmatimonadota bacterium]
MPSRTPSHAVLSTAQIRSRFPALARVHNQHPVAYFDGPGGTQVPTDVGEAMLDYLYHHNANTHWAYPSSVETDAMLAAARQAAADLLNAKAEEVVFGNNMTTITFHVSRALGRAWGPGDEVVVTELDHHANQAPWQALARERGITVRVARMRPEDGTLDWAHLESLVGPRTRLLAIGAASNALGTINDIPRATQLARTVGALTYVDAVHYAAHGLVDVQAWDCDFLACSSYKFYGPHAGILYGRSALLQGLDVPKLIPAPDEAPERLETGTQNHEGIVGIGAAIDFIASIGDGSTRRESLVSAMQALHQRGDDLIARLWTGLAAIPGVTLYGRTPGTGPRTPTLSFVKEGIHPTDVARRLTTSGLFLSDGDFYATTVIERLGHAATGVVRAGCACYTTEEEVDRLIHGVRAL